MTMKITLLLGVAAMGLGACAHQPRQLAPAPTVTPTAETSPVATLDDAADDPAIWRNAANPAASLVVGTDKKAGLHVYDLSGRELAFAPSPRLNNVDLRDGVTINGRKGVLVGASDRADPANARLALFELDTTTAALRALGRLPVGPGEAYGMCLWTRASDGQPFGFVVTTQGTIYQVRIDAAGPAPTAEVVRSLKVPTQPEGCVADERTGLLYVGEEDAGIWRFDADPAASSEGTMVARVDRSILHDDVEGLALAPEGTDGGYLVASSQGDNAFVLYRLPGFEYAGRFRIADGAVDGVNETDGIDLALGDFGPDYPAGLFVVQDGDNSPAPQNFKYVSWADVLRSLGL